MNPTILFEDQDVCVIQKPFGLVVNRAITTKEPTVQDWMAEKLGSLAAITERRDMWQPLMPSDFTEEYGTPEQIFTERLGMVHRLDKDTSGALVLAKNPGSLLHLLKQFRERSVEKRYVCLVHGKIAQQKGEINAPIGRLSRDRKLFGVVAGGREAVTLFEVRSFFAGLHTEQFAPGDVRQAGRLYQGFSLVNCWPKTGRTHQIRVHMKHIQHPLVGDEQYVGRKRAKLDQTWCPRQFLHAEQITFTHPRTNQEITVVAPLPPDLETVLQLLQS